ncbi:MAG: DUF3135 domain-containing protein [Gammaproteobacteria bacterium]|nr:MAG: DUF3135 domain-containing protein [Gammaproteobacteria bacterium]
MKKTPTIAGKDFDEWATLAKEDPQAFEKMRLAAIDEYIASAPDTHRQRLRRLQWRIDQERRLARSPMSACLRISHMMWDSLLGKGGLRDQLLGFVSVWRSGEAAPLSAPVGTEGARILAFQRGGRNQLRSGG